LKLKANGGATRIAEIQDGEREREREGSLTHFFYYLSAHAAKGRKETGTTVRDGGGGGGGNNRAMTKICIRRRKSFYLGR
jgi:hypothetical protein